MIQVDEITKENLWNQEALAQASLLQMSGGLAEVRAVVKCPFPEKKKNQMSSPDPGGNGRMDSLA